jgi:hypothetical protein
MKEINKSIAAMIASMLMLLAPALLLLSLSNKCSAQAYFLPATHAENSTSTSSAAANTGNDVKDNFYVWVGEGSTPTIAWNNGSYSGTDVISSLSLWNVYDPDVTLVYDGMEYWAIVVYVTDSYNPGYYTWMWEPWKWTGSAFTYDCTDVLEDNGTTFGTINIDADYNNETFVTVWDDGSGINAQTGDIDYMTPEPELIGSPFSLYSGSGYIYPDVSMYDGNTSGSHYIFYTYDYGNQVYVDKALFGSPSSLTNVFTSGSLTATESPRIASPAYSSGNLSFYTVVYNDAATGSQKIWGYTDGYSTNEYTDQCSTSIEGLRNGYPQKNTYPVVAYTNNYNSYYATGGIVVAWSYYYDETNVSFQPGGIYPIAVGCDHRGDPLTSPQCYYLFVPYYLNTSNLDYQDNISLAGRDNGTLKMFYTWHSEPASSLQYKVSGFGGSALRKQDNEIAASNNSGIFPNPNNGNFNVILETNLGEMITLEIYNAMGQKVYSSNEVSQTINYSKEISITNFKQGIYFVKETGTTTNNNWKIILTN